MAGANKASVFVQVETPGEEWPQIYTMLAKARMDDETAILADDEVLLVGRVFQGDPPVGVPVGAATVGADGLGVHVILAGGQMIAAKPILDHVCKMAQSMGLNKVFTAGRKGWDRVLPFKCVGVRAGIAYYELELIDG